MCRNRPKRLPARSSCGSLTPTWLLRSSASPRSPRHLRVLLAARAATSWKGDPKPPADGFLDKRHLVRVEQAYRTHEPRERNSDKTLRIESTGLEKRNAKLHLEARTPQAGGVGHQRNQRAVGVASGHAQYKRWSNLGGKAEVHDPNFAPNGRPQKSGFSRRSSDRKTWSAAATSSSSDGVECSERATRRSSADTTSSCSLGGSPSRAASTASAPRLMGSDSHRCSLPSRSSQLVRPPGCTQISFENRALRQG